MVSGYPFSLLTAFAASSPKGEPFMPLLQLAIMPFSYSSTSYSRVWNTKGSCFSQLASQWVPGSCSR